MLGGTAPVLWHHGGWPQQASRAPRMAAGARQTGRHPAGDRSVVTPLSLSRKKTEAPGQCRQAASACVPLH